MNSTKTVRTIAGAAIAAGAMLFMTMPGGAAHAEGSTSGHNLKQIGLASISYESSRDGDVDGRDFLVWQRGGSVEAGDYNAWQTNFGVGASSDSSAIIEHELGHVLGFRHEHTRPESADGDGDGRDLIDGQQDDDSVRMGAGNDVYQWDPGDGDDAVEGQVSIGDLADWQSNYGSGH